MFYVRHWSFAASCRGNFELAAGLLLSRLRMFAARSDNQLARSIRGQLAALYLRMGQYEKALEQLDIAQIGVSPQVDIVSGVTNARHLAYYHMLSGNPKAAYKVLHSALDEARRQGYERPIYLGGALLELLCAFQGAGMPAASLLFGGPGAATLPQGAQPYVAGRCGPLVRQRADARRK